MIKIAEGKTKIIWAIPGVEDEVIIESKDQITAGDGAKKDIIEGKGIFSNETACNCFSFLNSRRIPTHFIEKVNSRAFRARKAKMIPIELVARRIAAGSFLKRRPEIREGTIFDEIVTEFFLKDDIRHDPLMIWNDKKQCFELYDAKLPLKKGYLGDLIPQTLTVPKDSTEIEQLRDLLIKVFLLLEEAWASQNVSLVDLKIECGFDVATDKILVADIIDNDSWRIWPFGDKRQMKDKQVYRDLIEMTPEAKKVLERNYIWVAEATKKFSSFKGLAQ